MAKLSTAQSQGSVAVASFTGNREFWSQLRPELAQPLPFSGLFSHLKMGWGVELTTGTPCQLRLQPPCSRRMRPSHVRLVGYFFRSERDAHPCP